MSTASTKHNQDPSEDIPTAELDEILVWQLLVAWAGERANADAPRLSWWNTDLTDPDGGGDFLARLLPSTHLWAGLRGAREAARRTELRMLRALGGAGRVRSLFWFDRAVDEAIEERLDDLSIQGEAPPASALVWPCPIDLWDRDRFEKVLSGAAKVSAEAVSGGRRVKLASGASRSERVRALAAALVPLVDAYPMPFVQD